MLCVAVYILQTTLRDIRHMKSEHCLYLMKYHVMNLYEGEEMLIFP
jgi:hypothetical protein